MALLTTPPGNLLLLAASPMLGRRIRDNVARFGAGEPLEGIIDPAAGY
jgi:hypothetical protein